MDRNAPFTAEALLKLTSSKPVTTVFDAISSAETQEHAVDLAARGAQVGIVLEPTEVVKAKSAEQNKTIVHVLGLKTLTPHHVKLMREFWANATKLLEDGDIKV